MPKAYFRESYLGPLANKKELYIGIELEFPIVNLSGQATKHEVCHGLMAHLMASGSFSAEKHDEDGYPVQLCDKETGDCVLFEVSYNILELAFGRVKTMQEVDGRYQAYMRDIQSFLAQHGHALQGIGIHPGWEKNDNSGVKLPRYQMLMNYLALAAKPEFSQCHPFVTYGGFICGSQVQLDVNQANYLSVLNAFNKLEPVKAYLFANSSFAGADWPTTIARDVFWEKSMHGIIRENVGVYPYDFKTDEDYLDYLSKTAMFTLERDGETYYFQPVPVTDYLKLETLEAYTKSGQSIFLSPRLADLQSHRAYHYQALTRRGTVEFRSVCAQPLNRTFAPAAFHLGLLENRAELEDYLQQADFFKVYGRDYPALRRQFSKQFLTEEEKNNIQKYSHKILEIAISGLKKRGKSEEKYLEEVFLDLNS